MSRLAFDIETDGLLQECTRMWCAVLVDVDSDYSEIFTEENDPGFKRLLGVLKDPNNEIITHNGFSFDFKVIGKLYNIDLTKTNKVQDTMVMSQVLYGNLKEEDYKTWHDVSKNLKGSHSLGAWGYRLKCYKGEYKGGFDQLNQEMIDYCRQDGEVTKKLFKFLEEKIPERTWK